MKRRRAAIKRSRGRGFLGIDGAAAVEFAITAPMLVVLVLGIADYGLQVADSSALEGATRAGAEVGKANPSVTAAQLTAFFPSGITPTVTSVCTCVVNTWPTGAACPPGVLATTSTCAGKTNPFIAGNPVDPRVFEYVQVSATQAVNPIVSYGTYTSAKSVNGNTIIRFQ